MAIWPVKIVGNPATFDVKEYQPTAGVGTVYVDPGDVVFWNNATTQTHQISLLETVPNKGIVTPKHQTDAFVIIDDPGTTIPYHCVMHTTETGQIIVNKPTA